MQTWYNVEPTFGKNIWVRKYAEEIEKNRYRCNLCGVCIKLPGKTYNNLKRHFCRKHSEIFAKEEPKVKRPGPKRYVVGEPSVLKLCKNIAKDTYVCNICGAGLKSFGKSYGNLKRHFIRKHQEEYAREENKAKTGPYKNWARNYFNEIETNKHECKICTSILKTPGRIYGNLKRHFQLKHPDIYEKEQNKNLPVIKFSYIDNPESSEFFIEYFNDEDSENDVSDDTLLTTIKEQKSLEENEINETDSNLKNIDKESVGNIIIVSQEELPVVDNEVIANTSDTSVEFKVENLPNAAEQPDFSQKDSLQETPIDDKNESENSKITKYEENEEEKIKYLCLKPAKDSRFRTCFWNFFKEVQPDRIYACCFCLRHISITPYKVSNLKRHICNMHTTAAKLIFKNMPIDDSCRSSYYDDVDEESEFDKTYFELVADNQSKCKLCSEFVSYTAKSELFQHITEKHPEEIVSFEPDPLAIAN